MTISTKEELQYLLHRGWEIEKNFESIADLRIEFNIPERTHVLLSVGRHVSRKNFELVIKAVSKIKRVSLLVVGDGELRIFPVHLKVSRQDSKD